MGGDAAGAALVFNYACGAGGLGTCSFVVIPARLAGVAIPDAVFKGGFLAVGNAGCGAIIVGVKPMDQVSLSIVAGCHGPSFFIPVKTVSIRVVIVAKGSAAGDGQWLGRRE